MELKWLEDLVALAESGSLTEAARRRNVTQPAFTRRIKAVEEWLGFKVLDRTHKPARALPSIVQRLEAMRALSVDLRQFRDDILAAESAPRRIVIAAQHALAVGHLPAMIARVRSAMPAVAFRLRSANRDECYSLLMTRQASMLVAYETPRLPIAADETLIEKLKINEDWLVPVASPAKAVDASRRKARPSERNTLGIIAYPRDVFFGRLQHEELLPKLADRHRLDTVCETALVPAVLQLAIAAVGIAWIPRRIASPAISSGALVELGSDFGRLPLEVVIARLRTPRSRLAESLWTQFELTSSSNRADGAER